MSKSEHSIYEKCARLAERAYHLMHPKPGSRITAENTGHAIAREIRAAATRQEGDPLADLVARFSEGLLEKLRAAEKKYGFNNDWMRPDWEAECQKHLAEHLAKGDPRDVAAYAAFCWHHGWPTVPRS